MQPKLLDPKPESLLRVCCQCHFLRSNCARSLRVQERALSWELSIFSAPTFHYAGHLVNHAFRRESQPLKCFSKLLAYFRSLTNQYLGPDQGETIAPTPGRLVGARVVRRVELASTISVLTR